MNSQPSLETPPPAPSESPARVGWRHPFRSLPAKLTSFAVAATLVASLTVAAISVGSMSDFLRTRFDQHFASVLVSASERVDLWYQQRASELGVFAGSEILTRNGSRASAGGDAAAALRAREEIEQYLGYVLESVPQYRALFLLDASGETLLWVGEPHEVSDDLIEAASGVQGLEIGRLLAGSDDSVQLASAEVFSIDAAKAVTLHASLRVEQWQGELESSDLGESGEIFVVDADRNLLTPSRRHAKSRLYSRPFPKPGEQGGIEEYIDESGAGIVATALHSERFGWTFVVEQRYDEAFAPLVAAIRRTAAIDLAIVLALALAAYGIAVSIVRPIDALSAAALRIRDGEEGVEIPESRAQDEVGLLTRAFRDMTERLATNARELEEKNSALLRANETLEQLSITDGLTNLHNHRFFQDQLARETRRCERTGAPLSLVLIDIDHFKSWNDRLGHAKGDVILRSVASTINESIRVTDFLARYGGEEFALLAIGTDEAGAVGVAEKIRLAVRECALEVEGCEPGDRVTVSVGVAEYAGDRGGVFTLADRALYAAKASGRDCVRSTADLEVL